MQAGYAVVLQDCRGRFGSEGEFAPILDEASDGADTAAWIAQQPWSSGQVGTVGGSYLGFTQWLLAREHPEALRAMAPVVTTSDYYHTPFRHQGGVFELGCALFWSLGMVPEELQRQLRQGKASMEQMGVLMQVMSDMSSQFEHLPLVDMPLLRDFAPFYLDWLAHPNYDDYWRAIAHREYYEQMTVPALNIGGWYDLFLGGTLENYTGMKQHGGSIVARQHQRLVIGPWSHGGFTGKLVDVYPDGRAEILTDGILRSRYRESFSEPKLMEPGHIYELHLDLWATSNLFKAGHRIRLEVTSSNFPRFDRNTNSGGTIEAETERDVVQAVNRIHHDSAHPSHLILPIIERD